MFIPLIIFTLGISVGSFLNVVIDRLPRGKSAIKGRSYCDSCKKKLKWYDLIPLVSFIILQRRCRYCKSPISWQYPIVELTTGILFVFTLGVNSYHPPGDIASHIADNGNNYLFLLFHLVLISSLIAIFFTDLKYRIIPDQILVVLITSTLIYQLIYQRNLLLNNIFWGLILFAFFAALVVATKGKGMGIGDVKFAFLMGLLLGFPGVVVAFYLAFLTGAVFSLILIFIGAKTMKSTIPFGPFLVISTFISFFYGDQLWQLFKGIVGL